jgi:hypothetical protein
MFQEGKRSVEKTMNCWWKQGDYKKQARKNMKEEMRGEIFGQEIIEQSSTFNNFAQ